MTAKIHIKRLVIGATTVLAITALLGLNACNDSGHTGHTGYTGYTGDGAFKDHGKRAASMRYVVDLGAIDLEADKEYTFSLSGLPATGLTAGICLDLQHYFETKGAAHGKPEWFDKVKVTMVLIELGSNKEVFKIEEPLSRYTWTNGSPKPATSFLYGRGAAASEAASSSFESGAPNAYQLTIKVESETEDAVPGSIILYGGGWKAP
jgi:hypothetical protein